MANRANPSGFTPRFNPSGEIRLTEVKIKSTNSEIGVGDPLTRASGYYDLWSSGRVEAISGQYVAANAGSTAVALAYTDPNIVYSAQCDSTTGTLTAQANMGLNATIVVGTVASTGRSTSSIDESSGNTTATLPLKVIGLLPQTGNSFGQYNELLVTINNHPDKGGTGTVGV